MNMRSNSVFSNNKGISIIETLVALGIMSIMMIGFTTMISNQQKETKSMSEVLAGLDLQKNLITVLSQGSVCSYMLNNPNQLTFNSNSLPQTITPTVPVYAGVTLGIPSGVVAQVGQPASTYSSSMIVKSIKLNVIGGAGSIYAANWIIEFDENKSVRPHKPISVSTVLNVNNSNPASAKVIDCMSEQLANRYIQSCASDQVMAGYNADGSIKCQNVSEIINTNSNSSQLAGATCPAGQMVTGFNADGSMICTAAARAPAAAAPAATAVYNGPTCSSGHNTMGGYVCDMWNFPPGTRR